MSETRIAARTGGLQLIGVLDYLTAPNLLERGKRLIAAEKSSVIELDCSGVTHSSSVGLALLLSFMRDAKKCGKTLVIERLPEEMRQIAEVSGILSVLNLSAS